MVTVKEAENLIFKNIPPPRSRQCTITEAAGAVLLEDLSADRDFPPYHRVTMDGIALHTREFEKGQQSFRVQATQAAGAPPYLLKEGNSCIEVMTGAVLPNGCDSVIPVEELERDGDGVRLKAGIPVRAMRNVHQQGSDCKRGALLLKKGDRLNAPALSVLAAIGKKEFNIAEKPTLAIVSTGNEIVEIDDYPNSYQIRNSNAYGLSGALQARGFPSIPQYRVRDDKDDLEEKISTLLEDMEILILSGGISKGKFDYLPEILLKLGVKNIFDSVRQRPGKPFWVGRTVRNQIVFALPGNPVSALICFHRYILPYLDLRLGAISHSPLRLALGERVEFNPPLTFFLPVKIQAQGLESARVWPVRTQGSGDLIHLLESDGFIELPAEMNDFPAGFVAPFYAWV